MSIFAVTMWQTSDQQIFRFESLAEAHEAKLQLEGLIFFDVPLSNEAILDYLIENAQELAPLLTKIAQGQQDAE